MVIIGELEVCSQFEPNEWHDKLGGNLLADSIVNRIISNAYQLILEGESRRSH